jgi:hypothetical protein
LKKLIAKSSVAFAAVVILSGCSSVSVLESRFSPPGQKISTPSKIYVKPYTFAEGSLRVDRTGERLKTFQDEAAAQIADRLVARLTEHIAPAALFAEGGPKPPKNSWIIEGEFTRINQGSRAFRSLLGFGLGGTKMEATTKVFRVDASNKRAPLAVIRTSGGSNAEPGAILGGVLFAGPRGIVRAATSGVSADSRRTARMITATLSERLAADGAPLAGRPLQAKRPQN